MKIETSVFDKYDIRKETLLPFGFCKDEQGYHLERPILEGQFMVRMDISEDDSIAVNVLDADTMEEYFPLYTSTVPGPFAATVREACDRVLHKIRDACFAGREFYLPQSNRIAELVRERWSEVPDRPFERFPDFAVIRYPENRKWYLLFMHVPLSRIDRTADPKEMTEIINIKVDPALREELLKQKGIYPSYHMKDSTWISIMMDESIDDERLLELIDVSRNYAIGRGRRISGNGESRSWIVPANPKYYDVTGHFDNEDDVTWKQGAAISAGDTVYMYVAAPYSAVLYRCTVTKADIPYSFSNENVRMKRIMKMHVDERYSRDYLDRNVLKKLGIVSVRGARTVTDAFIEYVKNKN